MNQTLVTESGTVEFKGILTQDEADYVIGVGLNFLMQQGALPFKVITGEEEEEQFVHEGPEMQQ